LTASDYSTQFYSNGTFKIQFLTPDKNSPARIMPNEHVTITLVATAVSQVPLSLVVINNVSVDSYSSQPGQPAVERIYSDGQASSTAETVGPTVLKEVSTDWTPRPDTNDKTRARAIVGEPAHYNVTFAMPEGTLAYSVNFSDTLPDGFTAFNATAYVYNASGFFTQPVTLLNNSGRYTAKASLGYLVNATVYIIIDGEIAYNYSTGKPVKAGDVLIDGNDTNKCFFEWSNGKERREARSNEASIEILHSEANLTVDKWFDPPSVFLGDNATFIISLKNKGNGTAFNVKVVDTLGKSLKYLGANVTPTSIDGQTLTWKIGRLNPGETWAVKVLVSTLNCSDLTDKVVAYWKNPEEPSIVLNTTDSATLDIIPELNVTKHTLDDPTETGEKVRFTILMHNPSCGIAINVNVSDVMPPHFTYVNGSSLLNGTSVSDPKVNGTRLLWNLSIDIMPGETYNLTFTGQSHNTSYTSYNHAKVYLRDKHYVFLTYEAQSIVHILKPKVIIQKTVIPYRGPLNTTFMAKIKIFNDGPAKAYFVTIKDILPTCAEYVANSTKVNGSPYSDPIISRRILIWKTNFNISVGGELTLTFKFIVSCQGTHTNKAKAKYFNIIKEYLGEVEDTAPLEIEQMPHPPPRPPPNETPPTPPPPPPPPSYPELHILKRANVSKVTINDAVEFTIIVSNTGSAPARNFRVTDILPTCLSYIPGTSSMSGKPSEPLIRGQKLSWHILYLQPGGNLTIKFAAKVTCRPENGVLKNLAIVDGKNTTTTVIVVPPEIIVNKTAEILSNKSIAFIITIHSVNYAGPITVKDYLPPGLKPESLPLNGVESDGEITWKLTIRKGETINLKFVTVSPIVLCGVYTNVVEIVETEDKAEVTVSMDCTAMKGEAAVIALLFIPVAILSVLMKSKPAVYDYKALKKAIKNGYLPLLLQYSDKIVISSETLEKIYEDAELASIIERYNLVNKMMVVPSTNEPLISTLMSMGLDREPASAIAAALSNNIYRVVLGDQAAYVAAGFVGLPTVFTRLRGEGFEF
ncbi:MAG: hypothetical protein DRJ55_03270, partial [Thermoprotei archaeon]